MWQIRDFESGRIPQKSEIANKEEIEDFLEKSGPEETMTPINELTLPIQCFSVPLCPWW
jgi:hypothetical protein